MLAHRLVNQNSCANWCIFEQPSDVVIAEPKAPVGYRETNRARIRRAMDQDGVAKIERVMPQFSGPTTIDGVNGRNEQRAVEDNLLIRWQWSEANRIDDSDFPIT